MKQKQNLFRFMGVFWHLSMHFAQVILFIKEMRKIGYYYEYEEPIRINGAAAQKRKRMMDENIKDAREKRCFVITPIGDEKSEIRRHIDGIIDEAIVPALGEEYEVRVAHREFELGSINDRVIRNIYDSDLVIANLTQLNPNVMFEIGMRYSFGKPALVIAEEGTRLPFDVIDENTLFYINDPKGAAELRKKIGQFVERIDYGREDYGPIVSTLQKAAMLKNIENGIEDSETKKLFTAVNDRMDKIEKLVRQIQEPKNKYDYTSLNYKNSPEKIDTYYIKNIEDKDTIKRLQFYKNCLDNMSNEQEKGK